MKLAYGIPLLDNMTANELEKYLKILSPLGYKGVEPPICYAQNVQKEELKKVLDKYSMKLSGLRSGGLYDIGKVRFSSTDKAVRQQAVELMKHVIDLGAFFECNILLGRVQGWLEEGEDLVVAKKHISECMCEVSDYAGEKGIYIAYEPINRYEMNYNHTTKEMVSYVNEINKGTKTPVRLLMDVFHMMLEDNSIAAAFVRSRNLIGHVHFADSNRGVPGTGTINFQEAINVLEAMDYAGWIAMEVKDDFCEYAQGAKQTIEFLKPMIYAAQNCK